MKIPIKQIILEITALKARQMSLKAGIIPDSATDWKGALKKVRGAKGELLSGKELNLAKLKMGLPENNILQKLKTMDNKVPNLVEVGYDPKFKKFITGSVGQINFPSLDSQTEKIKSNDKQIGFTHTHPIPRSRDKDYLLRKLEEDPSGLKEKSFKLHGNINGKVVGQRRGIHEPTSGDMFLFNKNKNIKFPIYVPEKNILSITRIKNKDYLPHEKLKNKTEFEKIDKKMDDIESALENRPDYVRPRSTWSKETIDLDKEIDNNRDKYLDFKNRQNGYIKPNHIKFMIGNHNYDNYNLNGEKR